jgi:acetyl-CoA carboxylase biotin carboxyl carrier protein
MNHYRLTIDNQTYDVELLDDPRMNEIRVRVNGEEMAVGVEDVAAAASALTPAQPAAVPTAAHVVPAAPEAPAVVGSSTMRSPLPGVVKSIAVKAGDQVEFNQELLVIEAMKAMNIIRAPRAGTIGQIYVTDGRQIAHGAPLLDIN